MGLFPRFYNLKRELFPLITELDDDEHMYPFVSVAHSINCISNNKYEHITRMTMFAIFAHVYSDQTGKFILYTSVCDFVSKNVCKL